jgi:hypothetical protein
MRHERQRRQEVLAELAIRLPRLVGLCALEGEGVDQDRLAVLELDVVGARVPEGHPARAGHGLGAQREECRVLQL